MMVTRRTLLKSGALVIAGSLVAACTPKATPAPAAPAEAPAKKEEPAATAPPKAEQKVELTYTSWGEGTVPGSKPGQFEVFFDEHPNIDVKAYSYPNYDEKLYLLLASGTMPDFFRTQDEPFVLNAARGIYLNLDELAARDAAAFKKDDFYPGAWESFAYDPATAFYGKGTQFAIPNTGGCLLWICNKEVFADAGVELPANLGFDWTMDDFLEVGLKIRTLDDQGRLTRGFYAWPGTIYSMPIVWTLGGEYFNDDKTKCLLGEDGSIKAHEWMYDAMHEHHLCPLAGGGEFTGVSNEELIMSKKLALQCGGPWNRVQFTQAEEAGFQEKWDVLHQPKNPVTGKRATRTSWDGAAISPQTKFVEESWEAVKYMASEPFINETLKTGSHGSSLISAAEGKWFEGNEDTPQDEKVWGEALRNYSSLQPITMYWGQQWDIMGYYYDLMFNPETKMAPAECCPAMAIEIQYLLDNGELPPSHEINI